MKCSFGCGKAGYIIRFRVYKENEEIVHFHYFKSLIHTSLISGKLFVSGRICQLYCSTCFIEKFGINFLERFLLLNKLSEGKVCWECEEIYNKFKKDKNYELPKV